MTHGVRVQRKPIACVLAVVGDWIDLDTTIAGRSVPRTAHPSQTTAYTQLGIAVWDRLSAAVDNEEAGAAYSNSLPMEPLAILPKRFEFVRELGRGGMGTVYEALDRETGGRVAVKTLNSTDAAELAFFKREFRELQDIHHPNLVTLGELFCEDGRWAFSMELVLGVNFLDYVRGERASEVARASLRPSTETQSKFSRVTVGQATGVRARSREPSQGSAAPQSADEGRLRPALIQLARGIEAIHAVNRIHRDIKPSNVLVRDDGHVIILDFGLIVGLEADEELSNEEGIAGTPKYMSPEQVLCEALGPESDVYAMGVMLFEALTGESPFTGSHEEMMIAKVQAEASPPRSVRPDIAADLNALASRLLALDPKQRPAARDVVRALTARTSLPPLSAVPPDPGSRGFEVRRCVGRDNEFATLQRAFRATRGGAAECVVVEGESGIGKSFLVQRFIARVRQDHPRVVVLVGRCYEKESVPYKAFDSVIDALVRQLLRMPRAEVAALLPAQLTPLALTFPVLRRVDLVAEQTRDATSRMDPLEIRSRAFTALREIFDRICAVAPLVVAIDDMQWSDEDSMGLLAELVREPRPPPFLLLLTARPRSEGHEAGVMFREMLPPRAATLSLARLAEADARELAESLLMKLAPARIDEASAIAEEADGHALFIAQLVRYTASTGAVGRGSLRLEDVLAVSIGELEPIALRLFTLLCVAGAPMSVKVLAQAADVPMGAVGSVVADLRARHFLRTATTDGIAFVEPYHDRVRNAAVAGKSAEALAAVYEKLALAVEATKDGLPHVLSDLWRGAGDLERAGQHALQAAEHAALAFAFGRAAAFYERALLRPSASVEEQYRIRVALGEALAKAGRGAEAAAAYQTAALTAPAAETALDLERRAAEQLLRVGQFDAGVAAIRALLSRVGLSWPRTPLVAALTFIGFRIWRWIRGYRSSPRDRATVTAKESLRLDVCWAIASGLGMCDNIRAAVFQQRYVNLALQSGDARRIALAMGIECPFRAREGEQAWHATSGYIERAVDVATGTGDRFCIGFAHSAAGMASCMSGRFREAVPYLDRGQEVFRSGCPGTTWELVSDQIFTLTSLFWLGEGRTLLERHPIYLREASDRGDVYGTVHMSIGYANFAWLLLDDTVSSRERVREAMRRWWSDASYRLEQYYALLALGNADLYAGEGTPALARVDSQWAALLGSLLPHRVQAVRVGSSHLRARALLAVAEAHPSERANRLRETERIAQSMRREPSTYGRALAALVLAGSAAVRGDDSAAEAGLRASADALQEADIQLGAAVARRCLGKLVKGDEGASLVRDAEAFMKDQCVRNIPAVSRCLAPGFSRLE